MSDGIILNLDFKIIKTIAEILIDYRIKTLSLIRHDLANLIAVLEFEEYEKNSKSESLESLKNFLTKLDAVSLYYKNFKIQENINNFFIICRTSSFSELSKTPTIIFYKNLHDKKFIISKGLKNITENIEEFPAKTIVDVDIMQNLLKILGYDLIITEKLDYLEITLKPS
jgi:hypothetical protein